MTKFVLHGGATRKEDPSNKDFFNEMLKGFDNPRILLVYFAKTEDTWDELEKEDKVNFGDNGRISRATKEGFSEQVGEADVIYMRGGDTFLLLEELKKVNFKELIKGKVVGGSSAGTYVLVKNFYNHDRDRLEEGLGILNKKALCHYSEDRTPRLEELKKRGEKLDIIILKDCEFVVLEEDF